MNNPEFVKKVIQKASGLVNENTDEVAYHLVKNCADAQLKSVNQDLKDYLYDCMDWGRTDEDDEKQMERLKKTPNEKDEGKILKESPKAQTKEEKTENEVKMTPAELRAEIGKKLVASYKKNGTSYSQPKREFGMNAKFSDCSSMTTSILKEAGQGDLFTVTYTGSGVGK